MYAVLGNPIHHSLSPLIHRLFAEDTHESLVYTAILVPLNKLEMMLDKLEQENYQGLNITHPFKLEAFHLVHEKSILANKTQAINTIRFNKKGHRFGDNTDGIGLIRDLKLNHHISLINKKILILGAGGAVRGIIPSLLLEKPGNITIANRTEAKAIELMNLFADPTLTATNLNFHETISFDLILHATSLSLHNESISLPSHILHETTFCYDLAYQKETPFLLWAKKIGCKNYANGLGMLIEQAAESFFIWRGVRPNTEMVRDKLNSELS